MNIMLFSFTLWAQRGGGEWLYLIVFLIIVVFNAFKAMFEARFAEAAEKKKKTALPNGPDELEDVFTPSVQESLDRQPVARRERQRPPRKRAGTAENSTEERKSKSPLSRELGEQGVGARFEADPGTLDTSHLVAPTIEPTVKPTLESMTGIYEASPTASELGDQPLTLDIQKLIARPEGIRQAVILSEILKRPEF